MFFGADNKNLPKMVVCQYRMSSCIRSVRLRLLFGVLVVALVVALTLNTLQRAGQPQLGLQRRTIDTFTRVRPPVDCARLINGDEAEQLRAVAYQKDHPKMATSNVEYINMTRDCDKFIESRGYITSSSTEDEKNFPLAFSILVFKDVEQFERLLRAVYRPQNVYCVHVDKKAESTLHEAVTGVSGCFDNVFVMRKNIVVTWGTYSVMEPDILCMEALLYYKKWKYFINLTGQEFPLKTNWELVQILKALNGTNVVQAIKNGNPERLVGKPPPPIDVRPIKGAVHIVVRRAFVEYAINNENAQKYLNWSKLIPHASEIFFSTLNHNPQLGIPGSYLGEPQNHPINYPTLSRYKVWLQNKQTCHGKYAKSICIFSVRDLPLLTASPFFFANKFHLDYHPLVLDCLEEHMYNRTLEEKFGNRHFDTSYYQNLDVVKNHI